LGHPPLFDLTASLAEGTILSFSTAAKLLPKSVAEPGLFLPASSDRLPRSDPMKRACFVCLFSLLSTTCVLSQSHSVSAVNPAASIVSPAAVSQPDNKAQARILDSYGKLPLSFEANQGQADAKVKFLSRTGSYSLFLTGDEAVFTLRGKQAKKGKGTASAVPLSAKEMRASAPEGPGPVLCMKLRHANPAAKITGVDELAGTSNYFIGNDPAKWRTNVPIYAKVKYEGIYSGIDLVYYGNQRQLEYDFIVAPGADPRRIVFDVHGAKRIHGDAHGGLVFKMGEDDIRWHKPVVYQEKDGARQEIAAHYAITNKNRVGFEVAKYDASKPLYIDPLIYSTYLSGSGYNQGFGIAVDSAGNAYVTGETDSSDFPTMNPLQPANGGYATFDAFVTKFNPAGSALVYSTYLGGSDDDWGYGIAVDGAGNAYLTGRTWSTDFPTTPGAFQTTCSGSCQGAGDAFVTEVNSAGSALVYSTYLAGGSGFGWSYGIAVDSAGDAYVTGETTSTDFPTTPGAFQTMSGGGGYYSNAFATKINPSGSALVYSTYLGGNGGDGGYGIALDSSGNAYVTGYTRSTDFPTTSGAFQTTCCGAFVTKLNSTGSALVYSTYLGGSGDSGHSIAVDSEGNAYVTGETTSTDFPTTPGAFQTAYGGGSKCKYWYCAGDAFVTKLNSTGSALIYSTYLGGNKSDAGLGIAVDSTGNAYVTGQTCSTNFPTMNSLPKEKGFFYSFVTKLNPTGSALVYSTYLGGGAFAGQGQSPTDSGTGIAVDGAGNPFVTGYTVSSDFQTTPGAFQTTLNGIPSAFVTKFHVVAATTTTLSSSPNPSTYGQAVTFTAVVTSSDGAPPNGESVSFMKGTAVLGTGTLSGGSVSFTTSTLKVGTNSITAAYAGDSNLLGSKSKPVKQVVEK
jgi:Bacterial Ig-like domain (group 3)/Beta-propeller repeat